MNTFDKIYNVVKQIPPGKVASYGQIAALAGNRRWSRVVGYALHVCGGEADIPWHRVIKKDGSIPAFRENAGSGIQRRLLEREGVKFNEDKVNMKEFGWETPWIELL